MFLSLCTLFLLLVNSSVHLSKMDDFSHLVVSFVFITAMSIWMQDTTPLAGSSAGAIVCAVIASGASMEEGLKATKVLAEDCRNKGTAFRLGVFLYFSSSN